MTVKTGQEQKASLKDMYAYRHRPENMFSFAKSFWRTLLYIALVFMLLVIGFGAWQLFLVLRDFGSGSTYEGNVQSVPTFNKMQLKNTLANFQARETRFEALKTSAPTYEDPSQ